MSYGYSAKLRVGCVVVFFTSYLFEQGFHKTHQIWGGRVYIINVSVTRHNIDDISHRSYFMGYANIIVVIIYYMSDQTFVIHKAHYV